MRVKKSKKVKAALADWPEFPPFERTCLVVEPLRAEFSAAESMMGGHKTTTGESASDVQKKINDLFNQGWDLGSSGNMISMGNLTVLIFEREKLTTG